MRNRAPSERLRPAPTSILTFALPAALLLASCDTRLPTAPEDGSELDADGKPRRTTYSVQATAYRGGPAGSQTVLGYNATLPEHGGLVDSAVTNADVDGVFRAGSMHASIMGQGDRAEAFAGGGPLWFGSGGDTITVDLVVMRATAVWSRSGARLSGSSEFTRLVVNGVAVTVTGRRNQIVPLRGGTLVLNEQSSPASPTGGIEVTALHIVLDDGSDHVICSGQANISGKKPPCDGKEYVTGGGWIQLQGGRGIFTINAGNRYKRPWAQLYFREDWPGGMTLRADGPAIFIVTSENQRRVAGLCDIDGRTEWYHLELTNGGDTGRFDIFSLQTSTSASGYLQDGNIWFHRADCR